MDDTEHDTKLGGWTDQPERDPKPFRPRFSGPPEQPADKFRVWRNVALVVALTTALAWTLKVAVGL